MPSEMTDELAITEKSNTDLGSKLTNGLKHKSVSPAKTMKLLREFENLKPRSEQNFTAVYEKDMSSSEESSPMYQKWKKIKLLK